MVLQCTLTPKWLPFLMNISLVCLPVRTPQLFLQLIQPVPFFLMIPLRLPLQLYSISFQLCKTTNLMNLMSGLYLLLNLSEFIAVPLSILFNKSQNSGILPPDYIEVCQCNTHSQKKVHGI